MAIDKNNTELKIGDWVNCKGIKTCILDIIQKNETNKHLIAISPTAIGVPMPYSCNEYTHHWKDCPKLASKLDKCFVLQHKIYWVFAKEVTKISEPNNEFVVGDI